MKYFRNNIIKEVIISPPSLETLAKYKQDLEEAGSNFKLYQLGGMIDQQNMTTSVVEYIHKEDKLWNHFCDLPSPRAYFGASFHDNKIFIAGGETINPDNGQVEISKDVMFLDLESKEFHHLEPMSAPRAGCTSVIVNNSFYVLGGNVNSQDAFGEFYDFEYKFWHLLPSIPLLVTSPCIAACERFVYVIGKFDQKTYIQKYDSVTQSWKESPCEAPDFVDTENGSAYYYQNKIFICNGKGFMFIYDIPSENWTFYENGIFTLRKFSIFRFFDNLYMACGELESGMLSNFYGSFNLRHLCWGHPQKLNTFQVVGHSLVSNS